MLTERNRHMRQMHFVLVLLLVSMPSGCARVDPSVDYVRTEERALAVVGVEASMIPVGDEIVSARLADVQTQGLSSDEAVRIAWLGNPRIRAAFYRVGMGRADLVQAGLFTNPQISFAFNLPTGGGANQFGMNLAQNIADLWMIPARKRAARRDLDRVILDTAREAATLAFDVKTAYFNAVAAEQALAIADDNLRLAQQLHQAAESQYKAGVVGALDVNLARGLALRADVERRNARLAAATRKRDLATLMGVTQAAEELRLTEALTPPSHELLESSTLVELARDTRLDLRAADENVRAARARAELEHARVFQDVQVGLEAEHQAHRSAPGRNLLADTARASIANGGLTAPDIESRGQRAQEKRQVIDAILGPTFAITLPLFDQNQAQIAKAHFALQEAEALRDSLDRTIVQDTRSAADRAVTASELARLYEQDLLTQARKTLNISEASYRGGNTTILNVIDAQRTFLEVRQAYVSVRQNATNAMIDLERVTARPAAALLRQASTSTRPE